MGKRIVHKESISSGKKQGSNDDNIFIGENYAAVIDGVSHKSSVQSKSEEIKIASIIIDAIKKIDKTEFAEILDFDMFVKYINKYIAKYLEKRNCPEEIGKIEATGAIYSKHKNQIWIVGDCRAIYDGNPVSNPLKIDTVYTDIRIQIVKALLEAGYNPESIKKKDISKEIITDPKLLSKYIEDPEKCAELEKYQRDRIHQALLECGFSEEEIEKNDLVTKYYNPRTLQKDLKNNPSMKDYGYAVFNGEYTELKNCKVEQLPENVKSIKLFSDGFSFDSLNNDRDIGYAVRKTWKRGKNDPLSIAENAATHPALSYVEGSRQIATDDISAVILEIDSKERELEKD